MALLTGDQYRETLRDGREVYISGERVADITTHPASKPMVDAMAKMYDLQHDPRYRDTFGYRTADGEMASRVYKLPETVDDLRNRREMTMAVLNEVSPVIDRFGDETVTPLFVMKDRRDLLDKYDTRYAQNVDRWLDKLQRENLFMTSGNTDPKGDRSKQPFEQDDLDMYLRVVEERDDGIIISGAKYETGSCYAHVAFVKPTVGAWVPENKDFAVACIVPLNAPNVRHFCRAPLFLGADPFDHPLGARFDELDALITFDNVFIPWENVIFSRKPELAGLIRQDLPKWAGQGFLTRSLAKADLLVGTALLMCEQTGLGKIPAIKEKISKLMGFREGINAFLLASEAHYKTTRTGLVIPDQSIQNAGRVFASSNYYEMTQILRDLSGGAAVMNPDLLSFDHPVSRKYLEKYHRIGAVSAQERLRTLNLASELTATSFAGRMQAYQMFAESPPPVQAMSLYNSYDREASMQRARNVLQPPQAN
jgi:4-hydroxyphenylacetate 3-monooxygenase